MNNDSKIGIIGAGIGGLTTAIALQQRGFSVTIYEQTAELGEVGAGITISVNASKVLNALGLGERIARMERPTPHIGTLHYETGERLAYERFEDTDPGMIETTRNVHRADLHDLLADEFRANQGELRLAHRLSDITQDDQQVYLQFSHGESDGCDVVIACDGLKSAAREHLFSPEPALFTGFVAWRGLVERNRLPDMDFDPHFVTYPSPDKLFARYPVRQGKLINYVGIARKPDFRSESWNEKAEVAEVAAEFEGWHPDILKIINATDADRCMRWALYTREPLDNWVNGRVGLLGDAAHPMTPFYGMGAAMAIEDGLVLARCFEAERGKLARGLLRYEQARLERGNLMQRMSMERAEAYMNNNPAARAQSPSAGLSKIMQYDPVNAAV